MKFTFQAKSTNNASKSVYLNITLSPEEAIIHKDNLLPGESISATLTVENTGTVDAFYYISTDWSPDDSSTQIQATRLAHELEITVEAPDPTILYSGKLAELINQPKNGRLLTLDMIKEEITFTITLPSTASNSLARIGITFDLIFVVT
ncbi:hypothetical protein [Halonatronum saccharophilum]|uniref:hypothetical protein n=1 Tax=Halonatronum saccharophilum TaxID=150060 RepID=UPI000480B23A|nr:hypothetical protein [Halonatronum saccharophilum]